MAKEIKLVLSDEVYLDVSQKCRAFDKDVNAVLDMFLFGLSFLNVDGTGGTFPDEAHRFIDRISRPVLEGDRLYYPDYVRWAIRSGKLKESLSYVVSLDDADSRKANEAEKELYALYQAFKNDWTVESNSITFTDIIAILKDYIETWS